MARSRKVPDSEADTSEQEQAEADLPEAAGRSLAYLLLADVAIQAGSYYIRKTAEKRMAGPHRGGSASSAKAPGKSHKLASAALTKLATRSVPGAAVVGAGALAKLLFDQSQKRRRNRRAQAKDSAAEG